VRGNRLGGNDVYHEGTVSPQRPVLVVIDLAGNDRYEGTQPGIQGGALLGISMLIDVAGDDVYDAKDIAQGSAVGGVGILIDFSGNDRYRGLRRVQGTPSAAWASCSTGQATTATTQRCGHRVWRSPRIRSA